MFAQHNDRLRRFHRFQLEPPELTSRERAQLGVANKFVENLRALDPATSAKDRAKYLKKMAKAAGYRQIVIAALIQLAPVETVSVQANMAGDRLTITDGVAGAQSSVVTVADPR